VADTTRYQYMYICSTHSMYGCRL